MLIRKKRWLLRVFLVSWYKGDDKNEFDLPILANKVIIRTRHLSGKIAPHLHWGNFKNGMPQNVYNTCFIYSPIQIHLWKWKRSMSVYEVHWWKTLKEIFIKGNRTSVFVRAGLRSMLTDLNVVFFLLCGVKLLNILKVLFQLKVFFVLFQLVDKLKKSI